MYGSGEVTLVSVSVKGSRVARLIAEGVYESVCTA